MTTLTQTDRFIHAARLMKYLDKNDESVRLLTEALAEDPENPRLYRYRGHSKITLRRFDEAREDLERAAELIVDTPDEHEFYQPQIEQDLIALILGREEDVRPQHQPVNAETIEELAGRYKATLHGSVWYHLGLAQYLSGHFAAAAEALASAAEVAVDDDLLVAISDWRYMALRRAGDEAGAAAHLDAIDTAAFSIQPDADSYLQRLFLYKGERTADEVLAHRADDPVAFTTQGYGVANWHFYNGREEQAVELFEQITQRGVRPAFAYMAAEVDLANRS